MRDVDEKKVFLVVFLTGLLLGILYLNLVAIDFFSTMSMKDLRIMDGDTVTDTSSIEFICYLCKIRVLPLGILMLFMKMKTRKIAICTFLLWTGFLWGCSMSTGVVAFGVSGVLFCVLSLLPHMIFYIPAYMILMIYIYHYPHSIWNIYKTIAFLICLVLGMVLEISINPMVIQWLITFI